MNELRIDKSIVPAGCIEDMQVYLNTQQIVATETGRGHEANVLGVQCRVNCEGACKDSPLVIVAAQPVENTRWNFGNCFPQLPGTSEECDPERLFRMRFLTLSNSLWLFVWSRDGQRGQVRECLLGAKWFKEWATERGITDLCKAFEALGFNEEELRVLPHENSNEGNKNPIAKTSRSGLFFWGDIGQTSAAVEAGQAVIEQLPWLADLKCFLGNFDVLFTKTKVEYKGGFPHLTLQWPPGDLNFGGDGLSFQKPRINISSIPYFTPQDTSVGIEGDFVFSGDKKIHVDLVYPIDGDLIWASGKYSGGAQHLLGDSASFGLPGPAPQYQSNEEIELELEFSKSARTLTKLGFAIDLNENWQLIDNPVPLALRGVSCYVTIYEPLNSSSRTVLAQLTAEADFGDGSDGGKPIRLACGGSYPDGDLFLQARNSVPIGKLIEKLVGPSEGLEKLTIEDLRIGYNYRTGHLSAELDVQEKWPIISGVEIEDVRFQIEGDKNYSGSLAALLKFAEATEHEVDVTLGAAYDSGCWQFKGSTGTGQAIPIGTLFDDLAAKFSAAKPDLPAALADLVVENLDVSFNTESRNFHFECQASSGNLSSTFDIEIKHQDGNYEIELSGNFTVKLNEAQPLIFGLKYKREENAQEKKKTQAFVASYHHTGEQPLCISGLVEELTKNDQGIQNIIKPLDAKIDLKNVVFVYYKECSTEPNKKSEVTPDPDSESGKFLFGVTLDIDASIDLKNLPLVGNEMETVAVEDLQLLIASQPFEASHVETINSLLTDGVTKLPVKAKPTESEKLKLDDTQAAEKAPPILTKGINLSASLKLGKDESGKDISTPLILSPSGSEQPAETEKEKREQKKSTVEKSVVPVEATTPSVTWIKIQKSFGPVRFERVGFQFQSQDQVIWFLLDASLAAAGLTLSFDGLGFGSKITQFEPQFDLRGLGIDYRNGPLQIGGAFLKQEFTTGNTKYTAFGGLAVIRTETLSISAIGSYANLNGCSSLFIYAVLDYPLGGPPFFYVTGLAAGFGYNRRLTLPTVDNIETFPLVEEATRKGGPPQLPAGKDAQQETLTQELTKLENYIPSAVGQNFLVAGVKFTSFKMIDSFALLAVSFGEYLEIDILGRSTIKVPFSEGKQAHCIAEMEIAFKASFIPAEGFLGVIAQLTSSSYILSKDCQLTGGMAFYSWFSGKHAGDFVLTVGGYHSKFKVPAHYPQVPALAINWQVSSNLSIKGDAYFALTPSTLMAGGHLAATWHSGPIKAWFTAGADFLIAWKPFHYDATINVGMGVSYTYWFFGTRHITVELGADLHIWGPEFSGVARIHLWIISFDISFGAPASPTPEKIEWSEFQSSFLPEQILTVSVKNGLISASSSSDNLGIINPKDFSLVVDSFIPVRNLNGVAATYQDQASGAQVPGANFGIAPMSMSDLATDLKISLTEGGKPCKDEQGKDRFKLISVTKNVPAGLWGAKLPLGLDSDSLVKDVISGVEIVPACQPEPVGKKEMDASDLQSTSEIKELHGQGKMDFLLLVDRSKVDQSQDTTRRQVIQDSLRRPNEKRQKMLEGLGLKDVKITISEQIADVFMVAPQIEQ